MIVEANAISFIKEGQWLLEDIDWTIQKGEHWSVIGRNGSGKTTLLNLINGYYWPTRGELTVLGHRFGTCDMGEVRKKIGWVSSSLQEKIYPDNNALQIAVSGVYASIGLYEQPKEETIQKAVQLLTEFGCGDFIERDYKTLSQGERQKVLIVRALMADPELLILDEPCTGLDFFSREHLLETVEKVTTKADGPTLIYVTHHVEEILPSMTHTLLLKDGHIFRSGSTDDVLTASSLSDFFGANVQVEERRARKWLSLV